MRTIGLSHVAAGDGAGPMESNANGAAIHERPSTAAAVGRSIQENFEIACEKDPNMNFGGLKAVAGSLSHSHFNAFYETLFPA